MIKTADSDGGGGKVHLSELQKMSLVYEENKFPIWCRRIILHRIILQQGILRRYVRNNYYFKRYQYLLF